MKSLLTLGFFAFLGSCMSALTSTPFDVKTLDSGDLQNNPIWHDFNNYAVLHRKEYTADELQTRFYTFVDNLKLVELQANETHSSSINKYGDLTQDEFHKAVGLGCFVQPERFGYHRTKSVCDAYKPGSNPLPASIDWRDKGAVTPVKNQGQCGSCWSFSATGAMEGAWAAATGKLISLSEQQLVDCSISYGDLACNGGLMDNAFAYAIDNGMCSEEEDPYMAKRGTCDDNCKPVVSISSCLDVEPNNQLALQAAVSQGPVSVAIEADKSIFQFYNGGVINSSKCGTNLDHGVLIIGYGEENRIPYWLVKNSWGPEWGDNGYVKIARSNSTDDPGVCGIAMQPSFPIAKPGYQAASCGTCGLSYQACCAGFAAKGFPCDCHLCDGSGEVGQGCGDCGAAYQLCCLGFEKEGDPCQCDVE